MPPVGDTSSRISYFILERLKLSVIPWATRFQDTSRHRHLSGDPTISIPDAIAAIGGPSKVNPLSNYLLGFYTS